MTWLTTVCTEREPDGTYEDCTWASGVMLANEREGYRKHPQTQAEYEGLRADGNDPVTPGNPGSNIGDLSRGLLKRYGWSGNTLTTWAAIGAVPVGTALVVQGLYSALPSRLRRWSNFTGGHATCVVRIGSGWWWLDPLAPRDYAGEPITTDELRAFFEGLSGARAMAVAVGKGADMYDITAQVRQSWTPTKNASGASNGVLRAQPDTASPILERLPLGTEIITVAEITTTAAIDNNWRLVERAGRDVRFILRRDWIDGPILTEPVPPPPDCSAAVAAEYARVTGGTTATATIAFPEPPV